MAPQSSEPGDGSPRYGAEVVRRRQEYGGGRGDLTVVLDCADLERTADFWMQVLGYVRDGDADGSYLALAPADGVGVELLLQRVPEAKLAKNRLHLDLRTRDLDAEVQRVAALGATVVTPEPAVEDGWTWHILADPDGNEFCVIQPAPDYWSP
jgi:predicted enzyme related to lactoylglutathione lyase